MSDVHSRLGGPGPSQMNVSIPVIEDLSQKF